MKLQTYFKDDEIDFKNKLLVKTIGQNKSTMHHSDDIRHNRLTNSKNETFRVSSSQTVNLWEIFLTRNPKNRRKNQVIIVMD
jgi:hypothetical protein